MSPPEPRKRHSRYQKVGHKLGSNRVGSKLTETDIPVIRAMHEAGKSRGQIAIKFNVSKGTIQGVTEGYTWRHVKEHR